MTLSTPQAILFDLDGTLADTAPDLAGAVNQLRIARGLAPTDYALLRPTASAGARGLIGVAFGITPQDAEYAELRDAFLKNYEEAIAVHTRLFHGVPALLSGLQAQGILWGIVTNKVSYLTDQLVPKIGLDQAACVISGNTTDYSKPHPAPLLEATKRIGIRPEHCWYVGDDLRDIQAGQAAGMTTIAATWGYCGETAPDLWKADALVASPQQLFELISSQRKATPLESDDEPPHLMRYNGTAWGRPGFDRGCKAVQGIPRAGHLVNTTGKVITANDNSYALAA